MSHDNGKKETITRPVAEGRVVQPGGYIPDSDNELAKRLEMFTVETPQRRLKNLILPEETMRQIRSLLTKFKYHHVLSVWGENGR
jgi:hypothetical protein